MHNEIMQLTIQKCCSNHNINALVSLHWLDISEQTTHKITAQKYQALRSASASKCFPSVCACHQTTVSAKTLIHVPNDWMHLWPEFLLLAALTTTLNNQMNMAGDSTYNLFGICLKRNSNLMGCIHT
jgi:hypothetical protein